MTTPRDDAIAAQTAAEYWEGRCGSCAHPEHPVRACHEYVLSGDPSNGPEYCPCAQELEAMDQALAALAPADPTPEDIYRRGYGDGAREMLGQFPVAPADPIADLRADIEHRARMQDALDALMQATLWVHRTVDMPREPKSWDSKARSGIVGLRAALTPADPTDEYGDPVPPDPHSEDWYEGYAACQREHAPADPTADLRTRIDAMYVGGHPLRGYSAERRRGWDEAIATVRALTASTTEDGS